MSALPDRLRARMLRGGALPPVVAAVGVAALAVAIALAVGARGGPASGPATLGPTAGADASPEGGPSVVEPAGEPPATVATTTADQLGVYAEAGGGSPTRELGRWTEYGQVRTLLVVGTDDAGEWLEVLLPLKPNGQTGWVRAADVTLSTTTLVVRVDLSDRVLRLVDTAEGTEAPALLDVSVVIGAPETPTPVGTFYVTDPLDLQANPTGVYGAYALGLSGYSEVLETFNGAPPQIAIHGTNDPSRLGEAISNGCIRLPNDAVLELAELVGLGTPVVVQE